MVPGSMVGPLKQQLRNFDWHDEGSRQSQLDQEVLENRKVGCECNTGHAGYAIEARPDEAMFADSSADKACHRSSITERILHSPPPFWKKGRGVEKIAAVPMAAQGEAGKQTHEGIAIEAGGRATSGLQHPLANRARLGQEVLGW